MQLASLQVSDLTEKDKARFWAKVDRNGPLPDQSNPHYAGLGPCWVWVASVNTGGYGHIGLRGKLEIAHRVSWILNFGSTDPNLPFVLHKCDNRKCCNPDHLFSGNNIINNHDKEKKGRANHAFGDRNGARIHKSRMPSGDRNGMRLHPEKVSRGETNGMSKITEADVVLIRHQSRVQKRTATAISLDFGISVTTACKIINRSAWSHVIDI